MPLVTKDGAIGTIDLIETRRERDFSAGETATAVAVAQVAALAIDNAAVYDRLEDTLDRMALMTEAGLEFSSSLDLDETISKVAIRLCDLLDVPNVDVDVRVPTGSSTAWRASPSGVQRPRVRPASAWTSRCSPALALAMESGEPVVIASADDPLVTAAGTRADGALRREELPRRPPRRRRASASASSTSSRRGASATSPPTKSPRRSPSRGSPRWRSPTHARTRARARRRGASGRCSTPGGRSVRPSSSTRSWRGSRARRVSRWTSRPPPSTSSTRAATATPTGRPTRWSPPRSPSMRSARGGIWRTTPGTAPSCSVTGRWSITSPTPTCRPTAASRWPTTTNRRCSTSPCASATRDWGSCATTSTGTSVASPTTRSSWRAASPSRRRSRSPTPARTPSSRRRRERMALVTEASLEFSSSLDLDQTLLAVGNRLCETLDVPNCDINLMQGDQVVCLLSIVERRDRPHLDGHLARRRRVLGDPRDRRRSRRRAHRLGRRPARHRGGPRIALAPTARRAG